MAADVLCRVAAQVLLLNVAPSVVRLQAVSEGIVEIEIRASPCMVDAADRVWRKLDQLTCTIDVQYSHQTGSIASPAAIRPL